MNPLPPNADELVSAYLDGEAAPDEIVIVESDPALMERVAALQSLRASLAEPITPPAAQKEAHLSAALDLFDDLFAGDRDDEAPTATSPPRLAAVPAAVADASAGETHRAPSEPAVRSLDDARERRKPRRFNTGVIAAAAAAVLLFVGLTALSLGRGGNSEDVATSSLDDAVELSASDAADGAAMQDAEEAMEEEEAGGMSSLEAAPAPAEARVDGDTSMNDAAEADAIEEEAMDEEALDDAAFDTDAAMDDEEAMDEEEAEAETFAAEAPAAADQAGASAGFFVGEFADEAALKAELEQTTIEALRERASFFDAGLFPGCQLEVAELAAVDAPTLVGEAILSTGPIEIHLVDIGTESVLYFIDATSCDVVSTQP